MKIRFDGDRPLKGLSKGPSHLAVACTGVNQDLARRETVHEVLEPPLGVPLLVRVIEEDLKRLLLGFALGVEDANALLVGHAESPWCCGCLTITCFELETTNLTTLQAEVGRTGGIQGDPVLHSINSRVSGVSPIPARADVLPAPDAEGTMSCPCGHRSRASLAQSLMD